MLLSASFLSLELVWNNQNQNFLKLRKIRGQRIKQRNMEALSLWLKLMYRMLWRRRENRTDLVEETMTLG